MESNSYNKIKILFGFGLAALMILVTYFIVLTASLGHWRVPTVMLACCSWYGSGPKARPVTGSRLVSTICPTSLDQTGKFRLHELLPRFDIG